MASNARISLPKDDDFKDSQPTTQASVLNDLSVPVGHIIVSERWRNSELVTALQAGANILYDDNIGVIDFHPSSQTGVVYLSEADLVSTSGYRRKLVKLRKVHTEGHLESNPFCKRYRHPPVDTVLLATVQCVPKLGEVKARQLLEKFHSLQGINAASQEALAEVVGRASAQHVKTFLGS